MVDWVYDILTGGVHSRVVKEVERVQLPGVGQGPSDAYRHMLRAAEMNRRGNPGAYTWGFLELREIFSSTNSAMDRHNNAIGMQIGAYVAQNNGSWEDVKRLCYEAITATIFDQSRDQIKAGDVFAQREKGDLVRVGSLQLDKGRISIAYPSIMPSDAWFDDPQKPGKWPSAPSGRSISPPAPDVTVPKGLPDQRTLQGQQR